MNPDTETLGASASLLLYVDDDCIAGFAIDRQYDVNSATASQTAGDQNIGLVTTHEAPLRFRVCYFRIGAANCRGNARERRSVAKAGSERNPLEAKRTASAAATP